MRLVQRFVPLSSLDLCSDCCELWPEPAVDIQGCFPLVQWLLLPCLWWCLLSGWSNRAPRSESLLWIWSVVPGRWDWSTPTGREVTEYCSSRNVHLRVCSGVPSHAFCRLSWYVVLALLLDHLNHGHDGTWPWCLSDVAFARSPA